MIQRVLENRASEHGIVREVVDTQDADNTRLSGELSISGQR